MESSQMSSAASMLDIVYRIGLGDARAATAAGRNSARCPDRRGFPCMGSFRENHFCRIR
jgi:hypothetical protein